MEQQNTFSVKDNYVYLKKRKQVLQNKPLSFRPKDEVKEYLKGIENQSEEINNSILLMKKQKLDPFILLDELSLKYPFLWRRINRRNGNFIKQKIRSLKLKPAQFAIDKT